MSQDLRDLMVRTAESAPTVRVDPETWRRARRARRRELVLAPVVAAAVLLGALGVASQAGSLLRGSDRAAPVAGRHEPAMPSRLYAVPGHLGLRGQSTWTYPREKTLAIGVTAAAFTASGFAPVAVSALDGEYHLLDLPGHDHMTSFRFGDGSFGLSPDGHRLAYTWNKSTSEGEGEEYVPSGIRIVDLLTGKVESHQVREGFGVYAHGFAWSPDGRYLAYNMQINNTSQTGTRGVRNFFVERLDTRTGKRLKAPGMPMRDAAPAVTDSGTVVTGSDTTLWMWRPDQRTRRVDLARSSTWRGSVMSIGTMPMTERIVVSAGVEFSRVYVGQPDRPASFRRISDGAPRLTVAGPVGGDRQAVFEQTQTGTSLWTIRTTGPSINDRSGELVTFEDGQGEHYSFATSLLRGPTREFPAPDWPMSTEQKVLLGGLVVTALVALALWLRHRLRRRPG